MWSWPVLAAGWIRRRAHYSRSVAPRPPLSALLGAVQGEFTREFEQRLAAAGYPDLSLPLGSNVLRFIGSEGVRLGTLAEQARVSKQAISQQVAYLAERGYVVIEPDPADHRAKRVRLDARGVEAKRVFRDLYASVERSWGRRYGTGRLHQLRALLEEVAAACDTERGGRPGRC
jgi:DNA-binding MarR family transcriptional regulator